VVCQKQNAVRKWVPILGSTGGPTFEPSWCLPTVAQILGPVWLQFFSRSQRIGCAIIIDACLRDHAITAIRTAPHCLDSTVRIFVFVEQSDPRPMCNRHITELQWGKGQPRGCASFTQIRSSRHTFFEILNTKLGPILGPPGGPNF
jgi:hypothetical protein